MKLAKALKVKNQLTKELKDLQQKISSQNCIDENSIKTYDSKELLVEYNTKIENLILLKKKILEANVSIYDKIFRLSELKSQVYFLKTLSVDIRTQYLYEQTQPIKYDISIERKYRDEMVESLEKQISKIQDELDEYNYVTEINY